MRADQVQKTGGEHDVLTLVTCPRQTGKPRSCRGEDAASAVNLYRLDFREAVSAALPFIKARQAAATVMEVGQRREVSNAEIAWLDMNWIGTYAEYAAVPAERTGECLTITTASRTAMLQGMTRIT